LRFAFSINEVTSGLYAATGNTNLHKQAGHGTKRNGMKVNKGMQTNREKGTFIRRRKAECTSRFTISIYSIILVIFKLIAKNKDPVSCCCVGKKKLTTG
jgi:hypothetical protein